MPNKIDYQKIPSNTYEIGLTWASGATSVTSNIGGSKLIGIAYPSGMTNSSISIRKQVSGSYYPAQDANGTLLSISVNTASAQYAYINPADAASLEDGIQFVTASAEGAARSLILVVRPI